VQLACQSRLPERLKTSRGGGGGSKAADTGGYQLVVSWKLVRCSVARSGWKIAKSLVDWIWLDDQCRIGHCEIMKP